MVVNNAEEEPGTLSLRYMQTRKAAHIFFPHAAAMGVLLFFERRFN